MKRDAGVARRPRPDRGAAAGHRHARLQQIIGEEIAALVRDELEDPDVSGIVVLGTTLSVDYKNAKIRFALASDENPSRDEVGRRERALARATPLLRARLGDSLDAKLIPQLRFVFDRDALVLDALVLDEGGEA